LDKSHSPFVLTNISITGLGRSCLAIRLAIESAGWVGAANKVAGARARTREMVFVKIIVEVGYRVREVG
jgi:hypothetical protein